MAENLHKPVSIEHKIVPHTRAEGKNGKHQVKSAPLTSRILE